MKCCFVVVLLSFVSPARSQEMKELKLDEVAVVSSRTTKDVDGYTTNLKGSAIAEGKSVSEVL